MLRRLQRSASQPAGSEHGGRERDHLGVGPMKHHLEPDHDGGEDQQHEMIDRVRQIEKGNGAPPGGV
jgi:hypothetical protein